MDIGKRIQDRRKELNLSVEEIARRLDKNRTTVYRYEKGDIENLPLETLKPLAEILQTTPAYIMGWTDTADDPISDEDTNRSRVDCLYEIFEQEEFTDEECGLLIEYTRFLIYRRNNS